MSYKTIQLSKTADIIIGFPFASEKFNINAQGIRLVRGKNITTGNLRWGDDTRWWDDSSIDLSKYMLKADDIVIGMDGSLVGKNYAKISENDLPLLLVQRVACIRAKEGYDQRFLWGCIASGKFERYIDSIKTGTSIPHISGGQIGNYLIPDFDLPTQKKIAAILSALDEKIAINREINDNLEQQAFALFDSLFPRTIDGSQTIGDYINPKRGRNLLSKDAVYGTVPVVAGGLEPSTYHNVANTKAPVLTISASGANAGFVNLWLNPVWSSDSSYIDSSMTPNVFFWYILLKGRQKEIFDAQTGSAQPHIYPQHIAAMPIGNLNQESVSQFTTQVAPLFELIGANKDENERLRNIRDALLPRLMSGEIDVTDICI